MNEFIQLLVGEFDNQRQYTFKQNNGEEYPYCKHINTICNDKIRNIPDDFKGMFILEESYYTTNGKTHASPHLFLFTQVNDEVKLTSYELPDKSIESYKDFKEVDYNELKVSGKFTPAFYKKEGDEWVGGSVSMFSPVLKFTLFERFSASKLIVSETMEVNGKRTFGYDDPIEYVRI